MSSSGSARFVTRGRLCLASDGPDLLVGGPTQLAENVVHRAASRRGCGLSWSPSQPKPAALAALWESALNTDDDDLDFSPETMKQVCALLVVLVLCRTRELACLVPPSNPCVACFCSAASIAKAATEGGVM
eukprot:COSAG02_NODE_9845_length_2095_cov_1.153808_1_plen_131_part_00